MADESFNRWARQESPPAEWEFWHDWLRQHSDKQDIARQASLIILGLGVKPYRDIPEADLEEQINQIRLQTHQKRTLSAWSPNQFVWWMSAAAMLLLASVIGWLTWETRPTVSQPIYSQLVQASSIALIEKVNNTQAPVSVRLPDGSVVRLQPASRISFSKLGTEDKREVYLTGEAFFTVQKNPLRPFYVHANEVVTRVLGTSFTVKAFENQTDVQVAVRTGRVSVFARNDWERAEEINRDVPGLVLTPNQQVVFNRQAGSFHRSIRPDPTIIRHHFANDVFVYDETAVNQVFAQLEEAYGIDIVFDEQLLKHCTLTAKFQDEPLLEKLDLICKTINASYQIVDAQIVINAPGCY
ncbi:FecR family protein [Spirosoma koreense]